MDRLGIVVETYDDKAKVKLMRHTACGDCGACQHGVENMQMTIEALNTANAVKGDKVVLDLENANVLKAAFIAYGIPLIVLMVGMFVTKAIVESLGLMINVEVAAMIVGAVLMTITFLMIKRKENEFKDSNNYIAKITEIKESKVTDFDL